MRQNMATRAHLNQTIAKRREMLPFCENPVCPGPVWEPVTHEGGSQIPESQLVSTPKCPSRVEGSRVWHSSPQTCNCQRVVGPESKSACAANDAPSCQKLGQVQANGRFGVDGYLAYSGQTKYANHPLVAIAPPAGAG